MATSFSKTLATRLILASAAAITPALVAPAPARAQDVAPARDSTGPRAGAWAAELGVGAGQTATLLRFRAPTSAVLFGAQVFVENVSEDVPSIDGVRTEEYTLASVTARLGVRRYRATLGSARPFGSAGLLAGYVNDPGGPGWVGGAFGEIGASYFFSPHVSLGAAGGVQVTYSRLSRGFGGGPRLVRRELGVRASAVQLLGAVYF